MKSLSIALVLIALIVCGSIYGLPEINKAREIALAEHALAIKERNVNVSIVLVQPKATERAGLKMQEPKNASE